MASAKATIDHETIRNWVEAKGGCPAQVKSTGKKGVGLIRIDYPGYSGKQSLEQISWEEFFDKFEDSKLAFLYQDEKDTRFSKLVKRNSVDLDGEGSSSTRRRKAKTKTRQRKTTSKKKTAKGRASKKRSRRKSRTSGAA